MKAIFFDLDGTLLHHTREYRNVLTDTFESVQGTANDEWIETYNEAFYELFSRCEPEPIRRAFSRIGDCSDPDALVEVLREKETEMYQPPENVHADLERLSGDYALGVLTNGVPEWQKHKLQTYDLNHHFDMVVVSYEAGAHKPDTAPYRMADQRLPADSYAMIGDSETDIEGAQNAGWSAHRYHGEGFEGFPDAIEWK